MKAKTITTVIVLVIIISAFAYALSHPAKPSSHQVTPQPSSSASKSPSPSAESNAGASTSTRTPVSQISQCGTSDLALTLDSTGGGAAGTTYRQAVLTNRSSHSCTIGGFPGVSLVDADDQPVGQPATRTGQAGPTVTLAPGKSAASVVGFPNPGNFQGGTCTEQSFSLKVYPPGQTAALTTALAAQACPGFSVQTLQPK